ncbi:MAG: hypothetical protein AAGC83_04500 [Pseudomonadota bacterium]
MKKQAQIFLTALFLTAVLAGTAWRAAAQETANPGLYVIYDSSNSMWGELPDGSRKYEVARTAMRALMDFDVGSRDVALRMYGHTRQGDCGDSALVVPFGTLGSVSGAILEATEQVTPKGRTPIDRSLRAALEDFGGRSGSILLISDGIESCDADPCALVREWADQDISITVHVVGLGLEGEEREAMQCIADAAGTQYRDAFTADELIDGVVSAAAAVPPAPEPAPAPTPQLAEPGFRLVVTTPDGTETAGTGTLFPQGGGTQVFVKTNRRYTPDPGTYRLTAGVRTLDGSIYRPVTRDVQVLATGPTEAEIEAPRPPSVMAQFFMEGEERRPSPVTVLNKGRHVGTFQGGGPAFLSEGTYTFRSTLSGTTQELTLTERLRTGDEKVITFEAAAEVRLVVNIIADATGEKLKGYPTTKLWQDGKIAYELNNASGGFVRPGEYRVQIDDRLNRFEAPIRVVNQPEQTAEMRARSAAVTVRYETAEGAPQVPKRVFIQRSQEGQRVTRTSEEEFALTPGLYVVTGWPSQFGYPQKAIEVVAGDKIEVVLRASN